MFKGQIREIDDAGGTTDWEDGFLISINDRIMARQPLSDKQAECLSKIHRRLVKRDY